MAKTNQVMKLSTCGKRFTVVFHEDTNNPFWLYEHLTEYDKHLILRERKRLIAKYGKMQSVLLYLVNIEAFKKSV